MLESILLVSQLPRKLVVLPPSNISKCALHLSVKSNLRIEFKKDRASETLEPMPMTIYGVIGTIGVKNEVNNTEYFVGLITKASKITVIEGNIIYRVEKVSFYCINHGEYEKVDPKIIVEEYDMMTVNPNHDLAGLSSLLSSGSFYFSNTFDLSVSLHLRKKTEYYDWENSNKSFIWNRALISELISSNMQAPIEIQQEIKKSGMLVFLIQGFIDFYSCSFSVQPQLEMNTLDTVDSSSESQIEYKKELKVGIISRLSCNRAGTRFNARGIDENGNVSNFVESELLIFSKNNLYSYTQVRGSIPLFWEQVGMQISHSVTITRDLRDSIDATSSHLRKMVRSYNNVNILNLLNHSENHPEFQLKCAFSDMISIQQKIHPTVSYYEFDYHQIVNRNNFDMLEELFQDNAEWFKDSGYTEFDVLTDSLVQEQNGVFRTNCLDCLDRTNVVQSFLAKKHLLRILEKEGVIPTEDELLMSNELFNNLCADNGDWLSLIYAGTKALKSSATRHGQLTLSGLIDDGVKSVTRFLNLNRQLIHKFQDSTRQQSIDLLLHINTTPSLSSQNYYDLLGITAAANAVMYTTQTVSETVTLAGLIELR